MLKKLVLTLLLSVFVSFTFLPGGTHGDTLNPMAITYEGMVNPLEATDPNIYKPYKFVPASGGFIVWAKAIDVDKQPIYIAVFIFNNRAAVITYYFDKVFYQVALPANDATHYELMEGTEYQLQRYQIDFTDVFGVSFPLE